MVGENMSISNDLAIHSNPNYYVPPSRKKWPNLQTLFNSTLITSNLICLYIDVSKKNCILINTPLRGIIFIKSIKDKEYYKTFFSVIAYASLFFPKGRIIAIGLDVFSEIINYYKKTEENQENQSLLKNRLDANDIANACKILDIDENQSKNLSLIEKNFDKIIKSLEVKKSKVEKFSKKLASEVQLVMDDTWTAYKTLKRHNESVRNCI